MISSGKTFALLLGDQMWKAANFNIKTARKVPCEKVLYALFLWFYFPVNLANVALAFSLSFINVSSERMKEPPTAKI